jgi:hypothetical protein
VRRVDGGAVSGSSMAGAAGLGHRGGFQGWGFNRADWTHAFPLRWGIFPLPHCAPPIFIAKCTHASN